MTTATLENCLAQIAALSKELLTIKEQNNELHACNQQLLRQHKAHQTELVIVKETMKLNGFKPFKNKDAFESITIPQQSKANRIYKSLDGNTPLKQMAKEVEASYQKT